MDKREFDRVWRRDLLTMILLCVVAGVVVGILLAIGLNP